jgi:hypothetical protein
MTSLYDLAMEYKRHERLYHEAPVLNAYCARVCLEIFKGAMARLSEDQKKFFLDLTKCRKKKGSSASGCTTPPNKPEEPRKKERLI